jgi:hypothetical protein
VKNFQADFFFGQAYLQTQTFLRDPSFLGEVFLELCIHELHLNKNIELGHPVSQNMARKKFTNKKTLKLKPK